MSKRICWDGECPVGFPICCRDCEAFQACPSACNVIEECLDEDTGKDDAKP